MPVRWSPQSKPVTKAPEAEMPIYRSLDGGPRLPKTLTAEMLLERSLQGGDMAGAVKVTGVEPVAKNAGSNGQR